MPVTGTDKEKTSLILKALLENHSADCCLVEMPHVEDWGWVKRRTDLITLKPCKPFTVTAYEIKVSVSDFKNDSIEKQEFALKHCNRFYYVTPNESKFAALIPSWAGWRPYDGKKFTVRRQSPKSEAVPPDWRMVANAIRNSARCRRDVADMRLRMRDNKYLIQDLKNQLAASQRREIQGRGSKIN